MCCLRVARFISVMFFFLFLPFSLQAQDTSSADRVYFGPQLSWGDETDFALGIRAETWLESLNPSDGIRARGIASFDYFFPDDGGFDGVDVSYLELSVGTVLNFTIPNNPNMSPYGGLGIHWARGSISGFGESSSDSELGLNVLAGLLFGANQPSFFVELRSESQGAEQLVITFGALW